MQYACTAQTRTGARCRQFVEVDDFGFDNTCRCSQHFGSQSASTPDTILLKFRVNRERVEKLKAIGIHPKKVDFGKRETRHTQHAHQHGRQAYQVRPEVADSGVPVFEKNGLNDVSPLPGVDELMNVGYDILNVYLEPARDNNDMFVLVLRIAKEGERQPYPTEVATEVGELVSSTWGFLHVWANPPREDGKVVHTLNFAHREKDKSPALELTFNLGIWGCQTAS